MASQSVATVILAAGKGTRMRSDVHKVLHPIAGKPMVGHLMDATAELEPTFEIMVVGAGRDQLQAAFPKLSLVTQDPQLGTGHAVGFARDALQGFSGAVLILYGDTPFVPAATMRAMVDALADADIVVLGFTPQDPGRYGRLILGEDGALTRIVEFKDATDAERAVTLCNSGVMAVRGDKLFQDLDQITNENAAREYYLTDLVSIVRARGGRAAVVHAEENDVLGVNSREELAKAEAIFQMRRRGEAMAQGVTLISPETVFFSHDTRLGRDVTIEPNVVFGPGVTVEDYAQIRAFSHLEGAHVGRSAIVGPYARLRPGTVLGERVKVGNFVETKKAKVADGAKINHLSYVGDASVGPRANIGAGTITCNYDGFFKYETVIGADAFIGSNTALIAPVRVGEGAIVGAGSAISKDVVDGALAITRSAQTAKPGWAARFREIMRARKEKKSA
ncbi:MAG: bifunctional UDP-N-acetylglucosamine diphosphorylase/glucosamine-1-phosphate N-acetyltransferase GlmU [Pseudomonadota bacterium]